MFEDDTGGVGGPCNNTDCLVIINETIKPKPKQPISYLDEDFADPFDLFNNAYWPAYGLPFYNYQPHSNNGPRLPDYITVNFAIPIPFAFLGADVQITQDRYNNWYVAPGGYLGTPGISAFGGYILQGETPSNDDMKSFLEGGSIFGGGGPGLGGGSTWGHPGNYGWDDFAVEGGVTLPGGALGVTNGYLIYESGSATPWIWQR